MELKDNHFPEIVFKFEEPVDCPFCHHTRAILFKSEQELREHQGTRDCYICKECKTIYPRPRFLPDDMVRYWNAYFNDQEKIKNFDSRYRSKIENSNKLFISRVIKKLNIKAGEKALDIGTFIGWFCHVLIGLGLDAFGIESNSIAVEFGRKKRLNVFRGSFPDQIPVEIEKKSYGLITIQETSYYFHDLKKAYKKIFQLLKPNGYLVLKCHQGNSYIYDKDKSLFSRYGDFVQGIPTMASLEYCLKKVGFHVNCPIVQPADFLKGYYGIALPSRFRHIQMIINGLLRVQNNRLLPSKWFDPSKADGFIVVAQKPS